MSIINKLSTTDIFASSRKLFDNALGCTNSDASTCCKEHKLTELIDAKFYEYKRIINMFKCG